MRHPHDGRGGPAPTARRPAGGTRRRRASGDTAAAWRRPVPRPAVSLLVTEPLRAGAEYVALQRERIARWFGPSQPARGDGHPVMVFPGLATDAWALEPMLAHIRGLGHEAEDWGQGRNDGPHGPLEAWLDRLARHVEDRVGRDPRGATLVGWSLGGIYARELAKRLGPRTVRQVITMGTPFAAAPDQTHATPVYRLLNGAEPPRDPALYRQLSQAPSQPTTSIFSRSDGIVAWQGCVHPDPHPQVQDIEVRGSHLGMGWNPRVLAILADRLAVDPKAWRPWRPPEEAPAAATAGPDRAPSR